MRKSFLSFIRESSSLIRNIGIISHIDAGKTTTTERILFYSGYINKLGSVDQGSTVTDYLPQERERGITITSACIPLGWRQHLINLIDTPGHIDFTIEVERCVRVLDGAVVILDGVSGVEAQTETVWKQANNNAIPRILFVNKMDREGSSLSRGIREIINRLRGWGSPLAIQWPVVLDGSARVNGLGSGGNAFEGVVDLVKMEILRFNRDSFGKDVDRQTFTRDLDSGNPQFQKLYDECIQQRIVLVEALAELDDEIMDIFLSSTFDPLKIDPAIITKVLRSKTLDGTITPVLCGASFRNIGVQPLLDAAIDFLPSPNDRPPAKALLISNKTGKKTELMIPLTHQKLFALAFKVIHDANRGPLVFVRVYSGKIDARSVLLNTNQNDKEKATKLLQMYADDYEEIPTLKAGEIGAIHGLKFTKTGDTLTTNTPKDHQNGLTQLQSITIPPPVFFCSIEPNSRSDEAKFEEGLNALMKEDPSLYLTIDSETRQMLLGGMGELHLEISIQRLTDIHKVKCRAGKVVIGYRETLNWSVGNEYIREKYTYDREVFGKKAWASVSVGVRPFKGIQDLEQVDEVEGTGETSELFHHHIGNCISIEKTFSLKKEVLPIIPNFSCLKDEEVEHAVISGVKDGLSRGVFLGFPTNNFDIKVFKVEAKEGTPELTTSSSIRAATSTAVQKAIKKASSIQPPPNPETDDEQTTKINNTATIFGKHGALLEPIMKVSLDIPEKYFGAVTRDISSIRRGVLLALEEDSEDDFLGTYRRRLVKAKVPLSSMIGYSSSLRGLTQGAGSFTMVLGGYGVVGGDRLRGIVKEVRGV